MRITREIRIAALQRQLLSSLSTALIYGSCTDLSSLVWGNVLRIYLIPESPHDVEVVRDEIQAQRPFSCSSASCTVQTCSVCRMYELHAKTAAIWMDRRYLRLDTALRDVDRQPGVRGASSPPSTGGQTQQRHTQQGQRCGLGNGKNGITPDLHIKIGSLVPAVV
jgi:hypothetical protein